MDKKTLEMAAKAAGYKFRVSKKYGLDEIEKTSASGFKFYDEWKPLSRWSDTAMLAEAIGALVDFEHNSAATKNHMAKAATAQLAVVKLAAEIGDYGMYGQPETVDDLVDVLLRNALAELIAERDALRLYEI